MQISGETAGYELARMNLHCLQWSLITFASFMLMLIRSILYAESTLLVFSWDGSFKGC